MFQPNSLKGPPDNSANWQYSSITFCSPRLFVPVPDRIYKTTFHCHFPMATFSQEAGLFWWTEWFGVLLFSYPDRFWYLGGSAILGASSTDGADPGLAGSGPRYRSGRPSQGYPSRMVSHLTRCWEMDDADCVLVRPDEQKKTDK